MTTGGNNSTSVGLLFGMKRSGKLNMESSRQRREIDGTHLSVVDSREVDGFEFVTEDNFGQSKKIVRKGALLVNRPGVWGSWAEDVAYVTAGYRFQLATTHPDLRASEGSGGDREGAQR